MHFHQLQRSIQHCVFVAVAWWHTQRTDGREGKGRGEREMEWGEVRGVEGGREGGRERGRERKREGGAHI